MHKLLERVETELEKIADKGLSPSNLETTYKLIDIYKDIHEAKYYKSETKEEGNERYGLRARDSRGRYMGDDYDRYDKYNGDRDDHKLYYNLDDRTERHMNRMREGMENYNEGRNRYRGGDSEQRMIEGIEMTMGAICSFVECLYDYAETSKEKDIIRKHIEKMKKL